MLGNFIKYYFHKSFTVDSEVLFDVPPTEEEIIKVIENKLKDVRFLSKENEIVFVYMGVRFKVEIIKFKGKYPVDGKEF